MPDAEALELGRKIAQYRTRNGLSQKEFAPLVDRSEAWISQVERGLRKVPRLDVLERIAQVLDIPIGELAPGAPAVAADQAPPEAVPLRLLLSENFALTALAADPQTSSGTTLRAETERAWLLAHESRYDELVSLLESLLPRLEVAALSTDDPSDVFVMLARSYHACSAALTKLQQFDSAWVAADRAINAATRAHNPLLMAEGAFRLTLVFQGAQRFEQAAHAATTARAAMESLAEQDIPEALSIWGALTLQLAMIAARTDRAADARTYLDEAAHAAARLGADRNDYNTEFGPTNVRLHEVAAAVELGDAGTAIRLAEGIDAVHLASERRGRLAIDLARAWTQRRKVPQALAALEDAWSITPEQVSADPIVHTCVRDLLRIGPHPTPDLIAFAARLGTPSG
ncbi:helix-turn-helix domain-containing protein [Nocardia huaxiensis]|uniref:Helix-turn-helix domain-containing protein n=1 Tax=Nocardia huaxiensis TaxID=2755382 RepID=A0A7D6V898_9NOCA|nr:helix-turn-helix transcriptional regulator [Nocardia huaxiensis]QLY28062.1 helix-turn-helix domain-containing protein [Nocardia huaxiensis]